MQQILSITQVNEYIRSMMDADALLTSVAVRGEISNYKCYPSGHHYFTLKDENGALKCVMFKGNAQHLRFRPENGMQVIAIGKISVYPRDGAYQLYCTAITVDGVGDLHAAFEQVKTKLAAKGLFAPEHKLPIPKYPHVVGIITSSAGAAVHDILRILHKRWPLIEVRLFPVRVQGAEAPSEIAAAIEFVNKHKLADVLIVGRGGGSIEDLWAFNDELVAYAIYNSTIPIISAVGHEPDITIADYVADLRAATPSNGAELAVPDQTAILQLLDQFSASMASILFKQINAAKRHLEALKASSALQDPNSYLQQRRKTLQSLHDQIIFSSKQTISIKKQRYIGLAAKLEAMSPLNVLCRGYAMASDADDTIIRTIAQVKPDDYLSIRVSDGQISAKVLNVKEKSYE